MADETPDQAFERVKSEELGKGSDPRVAEGRAKAARLRVQQGLPTDPSQAWRAKLQKEGSEPSPPAAADATDIQEAPAEPSPPVAADATDIQEAPAEPSPPAAAEATGLQEAPAEIASTPSAGPAQPPSGTAAPAGAAAVAGEAVVSPLVPPTPEVGALSAPLAEGLERIAGMLVRDDKLPVALIAALLAIAAWAVMYAMVFSGKPQKGAFCSIRPDNTIVCVALDPGTPTGH